MPLPAAVAAGLKFGLPLAIGALRGAFGGGSSRTSESRQTGTIQDQRFTESFFNDPRAQQFGGNLFTQFENQLGRDLPVNEQAISDFGLSRAVAVNRGFEGAGRNLQATLAGRGLSFSPGPQGVGFGHYIEALQLVVVTGYVVQWLDDLYGYIPGYNAFGGV